MGYKIFSAGRFNRLRDQLLLYFGALTFTIIVVLSVINYFTVRSTLLKDVRENQLTAFVKAAQSDLKSQLEKGMETSQALADDPLLIKWFEGGETNTDFKDIALDKIDMYAKKMGYPTVFAANRVTKNYYAEGHKLIEVLSEEDEDDTWFFNSLRSGKKIDINYDYNSELDETFFFYNVLMGDTSNPVGVAGIAINPT
jgi:hypothetical protein